MKLKIVLVALFVVATAHAGEAEKTKSCTPLLDNLRKQEEEKKAQWGNFTTQIEALRTLIKQCDDPFRLSNKLFDLKIIGGTPERTKDWWNSFNDAIMVEAKIICILAKAQAKKAAKYHRDAPLREIGLGSAIHKLRAQYVNAKLNQMYIIRFDQEVNPKEEWRMTALGRVGEKL